MSAFARASTSQRGDTSMRFSVDAEPLQAVPHRSALLNPPEVVLLEVVGDLIAEHGALHVGGAEVDPRPHPSVDDLLECVREPLKAPCGTRFVAERAESDLVGSEEVPERAHERTGVASVPRRVVGEGRREEQWRMAN